MDFDLVKELNRTENLPETFTIASFTKPTLNPKQIAEYRCDQLEPKKGGIPGTLAEFLGAQIMYERIAAFDCAGLDEQELLASFRRFKGNDNLTEYEMWRSLKLNAESDRELLQTSETDKRHFQPRARALVEALVVGGISLQEARKEAGLPPIEGDAEFLTTLEESLRKSGIVKRYALYGGDPNDWNH